MFVTKSRSITQLFVGCSLISTWLMGLAACNQENMVSFRRIQEREIADESPLFKFENLAPCKLTTLEIAKLSNTEDLDPCIISDEVPTPKTNRTSLITIVQVTPHSCNNHRDGGITGVRKLNEDNEGKGVVIGFNKDYYVQFRLVSIVAGNINFLSESEYDRRHVMILTDMLETLKPQYIAGTCSFKAGLEKQPALDYKTIVTTQVGPPGFYKDGNPYVFGFHINSDTYPLHTIMHLNLLAQKDEKQRSTQHITVIYRTKSEFFFSTCQSAINVAKENGFTNVNEILYDHEADHDEDGVKNQFDEDFLFDIADQACQAGSADNTGFHPAIFMCTLTEQDAILTRLRQNGCRPTSIWATPSTWGWADNNANIVPFFSGGGQWHEALKYEDRYFANGNAVLTYNQNQFGYMGTYDQVVSYAIPVLYAQHIETSYRVMDNPTIDEDFSSLEGYEKLRRDFVVLNVDTIFGQFNLDQFQRNIGRGAAGTQWLVDGSFGERPLRNKLVSPFLQAEAAIQIPSENSQNCDAGSFVDLSLIQDEDCLLCNKCSLCLVDTYTFFSHSNSFCIPCPEGTSTENKVGATSCIRYNESMIPSGLKAFGYALTCISWSLALCFFVWIIRNRKDPVVKIGQFEFLVLLCVGAFISTSTIIALTIEAGENDDPTGATWACRIAPFLYTIGWTAQYGSLLTKSYRLYKMMNNPMLRRIKTTAMSMFRVILCIILLDLLVVLTWSFVSPLEYRRKVISTDIQKDTGITTITSVGQCRPAPGDTNIFAFVGPLIFLHASIMIITNYLLWKVRNVSHRYQEQRYVAFASIYVCEILLIGIPVIAAVRDNGSSLFVVLLGIIFLNDAGILCFIFIPKIRFQQAGLPEGVTVIESIRNTTYDNAKTREKRKSILKTSVASIASQISHDDSSSMYEHTSENSGRRVSSSSVSSSFRNPSISGSRVNSSSRRSSSQIDTIPTLEENGNIEEAVSIEEGLNINEVGLDSEISQASPNP